MINTATISQSSTYSAARAIPVMDKVFEDFTAFVVRGFTTTAEVQQWKEDILYLMKEEVLVYFEIQFNKPNKEVAALRYYVKADNSLSQDAQSGKLEDLYGLPRETVAGLLVDLNHGSPNYERAHNELHTNRKYGYGKNAEGEIERHHAYSKEGYGVDRNKIGKW